MRRLFWAIGIPTEAQHSLAFQLDQYFSQNRFPGALVSPANWHITVRFLGDVADRDQDQMLFAVSEGITQPKFRISLDGLGAFPDPSCAAVLWAGIGRGDVELKALAFQVEQLVQDVGLPGVGRPYLPHLSLVRMRPKADVWQWVQQVPQLETSWQVECLTLFETVFEAGAIRYVELDKVVLK